ncbi:hypothetical protein JW964_11655 [candidate division KSB1 bacterium]|nr:hypothetical protein [candidate division KSB1 bacterium]
MIVTRDWLLKSARTEAEKYFDKESLLCLIPRETSWYAITLLESQEKQERALANQILEKLVVNDGTHSPCSLFVIYQRYGHLLSEPAKKQILENLKQNLPVSALVHYSDGNVNHPLAAFVNLVCSGELFKDWMAVEIGKRHLQNFQQAISSRKHHEFQQAEMAEYNSPTYTALNLWFLAMAAEFVKDEKVSVLAQFLEERLWINVAMHWHEPTQQFAGPFSRAYSEDSTGGFSALHCTFGYATKRDLFLDADLPVKFNHPSALIENAFIATLQFHVPQKAMEIAFNKSFPSYFRRTTYWEQYHENGALYTNGSKKFSFQPEIYPGGWGDLTTYLTNEYCLGTASRPYINGGQNDTFVLRYRRSNTIQSLKDFHSLFTRMVFNESRFGQDNHCHVCNFEVTKDYLYEEGRPFSFQHQNKAILCYVPKRVGNRGVHAIRLDLIFSYRTPFDHFFVDNTEITSFPFETTRFDKIIIEDYRTLLAIMSIGPTLISNFEGKICVSQVDDFLIISIYNYQGEIQDFSRELMNQMLNGFVCLMETKEKISDLKEFRQSLVSATISRKILKPYLHQIEFYLKDELMRFCFDPIAERIAERTLNERDITIFHQEIDSEKMNKFGYY